MQKTKIEWCDYSWSPVTGCLHNCPYCYARRIAMRFQGHFNPTWHEDRIMQPYKLKKPSKIFVCSMADLFGDWVSAKWIRDVIKTAEQNQQHTFQFLTKNPMRYLEFNFPRNCWLGLTIDKIEVDTNSKLNMLNIKGMMNFTFVSFEPLLSDMSQLFNENNFTSMIMKNVNLVIIGAMTGQGAIPPKKEWINLIKHHNVFYKSNIKKFL